MEFFKEEPNKRALPKEIIGDSELKKILAALRKELSPLHIFFYGSRANQTHDEHSDYDFVVVIPNSEESTYDKSLSARQVLDDIGITADVFVYTEDGFNEWKDEFSSIPETAVNTGYEVTHL